MSNAEENGIIVGFSKGQEWLLPWWWMHYCMFNTLPITFIDFGDMSEMALSWCRKRGKVAKLDLSDSFIAKKEKIDPSQSAIWEKMQPNVWNLRFVWYCKPFALLLSPYKKTIWLDLDCQVRGSLQPMFEFCEDEGGFAIAAEHLPSQILNLQRGLIQPGQTMYNAGVLVFQKDSKIIKEWADRAIDQNHLFCSDQQLLASILNSKKFPFKTLSPLYNWTADMQCNSDVVILHWWGGVGKKWILSEIEDLNTNLYFNISFDDLSGKKPDIIQPQFKFPLY